MPAQRPPRPQCGGRRLALLACLLALAHSAHAQGLLDMFQNGAGATPSPVVDGAAVPNTPVPTTEGQITPAATAPTTATPTPTPVANPPATTPVFDGAANTPTAAPVTNPAANVPTAAPVTTPAANAPTAAPAGNATVPAGAVAGPVGAPQTTAPVQLNPGAVTPGTPPLAAPAGSDAAAVVNVGTVGTEDQVAAENTLPPGPPMDWQTLQKDTQLVFDVEIRGDYIAPFTSTKAAVIARVLWTRYMRSAQLADISVVAMSTFMYLSYDSPSDTAAALAASSPDPAGGARRLARAGRRLAQVTKSGAELRIIVATNSLRVDSEIATFEEGVESGMMARDITLAGVATHNLTLLMTPFTEDLIGPGNTGSGSSGGTQSWVIGVIVGSILLLLPLPLFMLVRWRKRKNREGRELQAAEAEAMRQRMNSRMARPGSKSFTLKQGGSSADIMVRSGSIGGLAGYANNGRLQSWGSPDRAYGQSAGYGISRQTSVTSMGSALPSARGASYSRTPSMPGARPFAGALALPNGAYEEEVQAAQSARSHTTGGR